MKLTESRIKQIILEEIKILSEEEPQQQEVSQQQQPNQKSGYSVSNLKQELLALGNKIQSIKGLDSTELRLISGIIGFTVKIASEKSGGTALKKIYDLLEKFNEK